MLIAALHSVIGVVGAFLLYVALFLRESEEGQLQNRLEKLWIDIDDLSKAALSRQTAFLQQVSAMANSGLNRLFGLRLFSAEAVSASVCFSIGPVLLSLAYIAFKQSGDPLIYSYARGFLIGGVVAFLMGASKAPLRYLGFLWIPASVLFILYFDRNDVWTWRYLTSELLPVLIVLGGGFLSDALFIALSRWCLRTASVQRSGWKIGALLIVNGCVGFVLVSPILWGILMGREHGGLGSNQMGFMLMGISNLVSGTIAFLFILTALAALLHLGFWPILERPIYSLQRFGVARNPRLIGATSVTCLMFAWPHSPIIQAITKLIHG